MTSPRMLFLICSERSGSNLIRAMMDAHPRVSAPQPLHFVRDVIARADVMTHGQRDQAATHVMLDALHRSLSKQFPQDQAAAIHAQASAADPFVPRALMQAVYHGIATQTGAQLVMIKENELQNAAAQIVDAFPEAQFVFQVRDPRDYLSSALKLKTGLFGNKFGSFRNAMQIWADDQKFGLRMLGHFGPERVFFQRYEDLVADTQPVLQALCDFAGLPFSTQMLNFHQADGVKEFSTRKAAWENLSRPVMSGNFNKYRETLSRRQIAGVEAALGPWMDRFGYARDTGKPRKWSVIWPSFLEPFERWGNAAWTPFFTVANTKHHKKLDAVADPLSLRYADSDTARLLPGQVRRTPTARIVAQALASPDAPALRVDGTDWSYDAVLGAAAALAATLPRNTPVVGVYAARHVSSYIAILAVMLAGGTYVPLNCRFPHARNRAIATRSGMTHLLHGAEFAPQVADILQGTGVAAQPVSLEAPGFSTFDGEIAQPGWADMAYLLFTSGSTGTPKGVAISHANLAAYLDAACDVLQPDGQDRFSQTFDLTFDLSVHDLFVAWSSGACVCVAAQADLADPARYITREGLTQWFSVPTLAQALKQTGKLEPNAFPTLRHALFCGEALPADLAQDWLGACPNAKVENWYGPTEATIACTRHVVTRDDRATGTVPIGTAFAGMTACVMATPDKLAQQGETGTLFMGGPQVAAGYLNAPDLTAERFVALPGQSGRFYDTGDLVRWRDGVLDFVGRRDFQVKIRGYRVELGEIETALRAQFDGRNVLALTWPHGAASASHVLAVIEGPDETPVLDRAALLAALPDYMIPSSAYGMPSFPTNASGKIDRGAIAAAVQARIDARQAAEDGSFEARVMALILKVKPTALPEQIRAADTLLMAGLDSLDFVNLTHHFEETLGVALTEARVAALANMAYADLVANLEHGQAASEALEDIPADRMARANRAIAFLRAFPAVIGQARDPLVLAYGSSGTMRGIDSDAAQTVALDRGAQVQVINIGLPALTSQGLARMAQFVCETIRDHPVTAILHELDPILVSTVPPKGDVALDEAVYAGIETLRPPQVQGREFNWAPELAGTLSMDQATPKKAAKALWERARDHEIAHVYQGQTAFDPQAVDSWAVATRHLKALNAPVLGWVHPMAEGTVGGGLFDTMLEQLQAATETTILAPDAFDLAPALFLNINHMAPGEGRAALTAQLMSRLMARVTA